MAQLTGTPVAISWGTGANPAGQSVTIPSDATAVYMFWSGWPGTNNSGLLSATLAGNNPDQTFELASTDIGSRASTGVAAWYNPPTGSQTLDPAWDTDFQAGGGPVCIVAFVLNGDTTTWRDADADADSSSTSGVTLTTVATDLVIKFDQTSLDTAPGLTSGWTNGQTQANVNSISARLSYIEAAGSTQACDSETTDFATIVAISIPLVDPVTVTSVTPDTFDDADTGIDIAGTNFEASQGTGRVVISPVDDIAGDAPAFPTFVAAGTQFANIGAVAAPLPAGIVAGDILLLAVETSGAPTSISNENGGTWTEVAGSPQDQGTTTALNVFWSRYNGTQGNPTVADSGDHHIGGIVAYRGCIATGDPVDDSTGGTDATADTSGTLPGPTTTEDMCLIVLIGAGDDDADTPVTGITNANLDNITSRVNYEAATGNDGGLTIFDGEMATAGAVGNSTLTYTAATTKAMVAVALLPRDDFLGAAVEQTITSWGDTAIEFTADQGTLDSDVDVYLFVQNDSGGSNASGFVVQFTAGGGGTEFMQSVGGSLTFVGVVNKQTNKVVAGVFVPSGTLSRMTGKNLLAALSAAGAIEKSTSRSLAGSLTSSGDLTKQTSKSFTGTLTLAGALTSIRLFVRELTASLGFSGALSKQTNKTLAGTLAPTGAVSKLISKMLSGALTFVGTLTKQTARALSGALSLAGTLATQYLPFGPVEVLRSYTRRLFTFFSGRR